VDFGVGGASRCEASILIWRVEGIVPVDGKRKAAHRKSGARFLQSACIRGKSVVHFHGDRGGYAGAGAIWILVRRTLGRFLGLAVIF